MSKILRTTEVVNELHPFDEDGFARWCSENGHDPKEILEFAQTFGTEMHEWVLEKKEPSIITEKHLLCYEHWLDFYSKNDIVFEAVETPLVLFDENLRPLCTGIRDAIVRFNGNRELWDLKCYGSWKEIGVEYKKPSSDKLAKANLQTYIYDQAAQTNLPRRIIHLCPSGLGDYLLTRRPLADFKKAKEFMLLRYEKATTY